MKKFILGAVSAVCLCAPTLFSASAATVELPDAFSDLSPIIEIVLKIVEFISKIFGFFG